MTCGKAQRILVEHLHGQASEATLLKLDQHLAACEPCRAERARVATLGALREWQPPTLSDAARSRIAERLAAHHGDAVPLPLPRRAPRTIVFASLGTLAAAAALVLMWRAQAPHPAPPAPAPAVAIAPPAPPAPAPSTVRFLDAELSYGPGTRADLQLDTRTVHLAAGELDVTRRAGATPLRIATPRFVVAVTMGHAKFAADYVQVLDGEVYVFSFDQKQLATVAAGQTWRPDPSSAPPIGSTAPTSVPAHADAPPPSVPAALDRARAALARGEAPEARRWVQRALHGAASPRERAEAELFLAESWLIESDSDRAISAYRRVASAFPSLPEGEAAAFAAAQVLSERGRAADAGDALKAYLARWPEGRFAREAQERLASLSP